ncbi:VanZ family protein [Streptomyces sp. VRA16 Mangrove soil]|uniref:VanZ family protein n=1 Tax=Streptomyces sp. VRA16 Mangrove soil TaxID=2817434 RepID=UPI001A9F2A61|nr:VanZ family protein [Streptomyces sp. VRA16 Mangrove soil]MBO1335235.1 VanZ family protein [Streptomyces sp. VRA16 Mangrove soil]
MDHSTSLPAPPPHRARRTVITALVVLASAAALLVPRRMLLMPASSCVAGRWHGCFDTFNGVVLMTLVTMPLSALVVAALALWRRSTGAVAPWRRSLAEVGMVHGTVPFLWLTLMPGAEPGVAPPRVSLVPLRDLVTMGTLGIVGNLLVFAALGAFAPVRFPKLASLPRILALGAGCSVLVETAQYVFRLDRVSSVDDVLVNAAGALLAGLASRPWWRGTAPHASPPRTAA